MNLTSFLKQTDAVTEQCSAVQLCAFIHDIGRTLPEDQREDFLRRLKAVNKADGQITDKDHVNDHSFEKLYKTVREDLKCIDSQEITIDGILNEEYDDWYDDVGEEFYYEDNSGVSDMLAQACAFVHTCMDQERYQEGLTVGKQLFCMEILCENQYGDEDFSIGDMVYHKLLDCDLKQVLLDTLYCAYYATPLKKRSEAIYDIIKNAGEGDRITDTITLEAVMQHGSGELPDFGDFLTCWIAYLGEQTGRDADRLIGEAVNLLNDISMAAQYAQKYASIHPGIYLRVLENENDADVNMLMSIGMNALKTIPSKYISRSRAALTTAKYLIEVGKDSSLLRKCYFAAYESDTSAINYLRALLNGYSTEKGREELRNVFMALSLQKGESSYIRSERAENRPDSNMFLLLRFLDGQFESVLSDGLNTKEALGWTGTFMKQGIALYLLLLYEGKWIGKGITEMADRVKKSMNFSAEEYNKGINEPEDSNKNDLFYNVFMKWKSMQQVKPDVRKEIIKRITELIQKRTEGIMDANRRNYYGECAAYIAAFGEVQESLGDSGAKQKIMTSYHLKYSRRSAFREELRMYGWIDVKRK